MNTDKIKEIDDLFSMFHDFEITALSLENKTLTMEILLPWASMWNIDNYKMMFEFGGCEYLKCTYYVQTSNELIETKEGVYFPKKELFTSDLNEMVKLNLDIQSHKFTEPNNFLLHCDSLTSFENTINANDFAFIELTASDCKIFDNHGIEMTLNQMEEWCKEWWDGIQKMWDE